MTEGVSCTIQHESNTPDLPEDGLMELRVIRSVAAAHLPAIWSQLCSSEPVTKGQNAQHWGSQTSRLYRQWYIKSNYIILILPAHIAVYRAVNRVATLNHTIRHSIIADIHRQLWCSPRQVNGGGGCRLSLEIGRRLQPNERNSCHISTSTKRKGMNCFQTKSSCTFTVIGLNSDFIPTVWLCKWSWSLLFNICLSDYRDSYQNSAKE